MTRTHELVGRSAERSAMWAATAATGAIRHIALHGDPGIGKTALLDHLVTEAAAVGWTCHVTSAGTPCGGLAGLLADLAGEPLPRGTAGFVPAQHALAQHATDRPVLMVLDDLHLGDDSSADLLGCLLDRPPSPLLRFAFAVRPRQASYRLSGLLSRAADRGHLTWIEVGPLAAADTDTLVGDRLGPASRRSVYEASGGNPLVLTALTEARSDPPPHRGMAGGLLLADLARLDPDTVSTAHAAAVVGAAFAPRLVAVASGRPLDMVVAGLDHLVAHDLVRPAADSGTFAFRHPVLRDLVYATAPAAWRWAAHARLAQTLRAEGAPAPVLAEHVRFSARSGDRGAVATLLDAADAVTPRDPVRARRWLLAARELRTTGGVDPVAVTTRLAHLATVDGPIQESVAALARLPRDGAHDTPEVTVSHVVLLRLAGRYSDARALLESALAEATIPPSAADIALALELAQIHLVTGDPRGCRRTVALYTCAGIPAVPAALTAALTAAAAATVADPDAADLLDQAVGELHAGGMGPVTRLSLTAWVLAGWAALALDRHRLAADLFAEARERCWQVGQHHLLAEACAGAALSAVIGGRVPTARVAAAEAVELADRSGGAHLCLLARAVQRQVATWTGDETPVDDTGLLHLADRVGGIWATAARLAIAEARCAAGDPTGVPQLVQAAGGPDLRCVPRYVRPRVYAVLTWAEATLGTTAAALGWASRAQHRPIAGRGHVLYAKACARQASGDHAAADRLAAASAREFLAQGRTLAAGMALLVSADARRTAGDGATALVRLGRAKQMFRECGADDLVRRIDREQRRTGGHGRAIVRAAHVPTGREWQIIDLVRTGRTNKQIAATLFLSVRTVESHLTRIYDRLGVSSRTAMLAALATDEAPAADAAVG